jgi:hypothetical protein
VDFVLEEPPDNLDYVITIARPERLLHPAGFGS